jgi:hypothetical protein
LRPSITGRSDQGARITVVLSAERTNLAPTPNARSRDMDQPRRRAVSAAGYHREITQTDGGDASAQQVARQLGVGGAAGGSGLAMVIPHNATPHDVQYTSPSRRQDCQRRPSQPRRVVRLPSDGPWTSTVW